MKTAPSHNEEENLEEILKKLPNEARMKFIADIAKEIADPVLYYGNNIEKEIQKLKSAKKWFADAEKFFKRQKNIAALAGLRCANDNFEEAISLYKKEKMLDKAADLARRFGKIGLRISLEEELLQNLYGKKDYENAGRKAEDILRMIKSTAGSNLNQTKIKTIEIFIDCVAHSLPYSFYVQSNGKWRIDAPCKEGWNFIAVRDYIGEVISLGEIDALNKKLIELGKYGTLAQTAEERKDWNNAWQWYEKAANLAINLRDNNFSRKDKLIGGAECAIKAGKSKEAKRLYLLAKEYELAADVAAKLGERKEARELYEKAIEKEIKDKSYDLAAHIARKAGFQKKVSQLVDKAIKENVKDKSYYLAADCCEEFGRIDEAIKLYLKDNNFHEAARLEEKRGNKELAQKYRELSRIKYG